MVNTGAIKVTNAQIDQLFSNAPISKLCSRTLSPFSHAPARPKLNSTSTQKERRRACAFEERARDKVVRWAQFKESAYHFVFCSCLVHCLHFWVPGQADCIPFSDIVVKYTAYIFWSCIKHTAFFTLFTALMAQILSEFSERRIHSLDTGEKAAMTVPKIYLEFSF